LGQLLGIAQRTIVVEFGFSPQRFSPRKLIPVNVKKLGDRILLKRIEANLTQPEVAQILGVSIRTVSKWEQGAVCPTEYHWQGLSRILSLDLSNTPASDPTPE
jgi:ribosome-binding protein aMBF1 (putative translation factor)